MPSRMIRDGLLDSWRWHAVSAEARCLFIALLLLADDFGLLPLQPVFIARRAFGKRPSDRRLNNLLDELVRVDLLRVYYDDEPDFPAKFGFLPRFRQKMRQMKAKQPMPPIELYEDDFDALEKFQKNSELFKNMRTGCVQPADKLSAEGKGREVEGKGREEKLKGREGKGTGREGVSGTQPPVDNSASPKPENPFYKLPTATPTATPPPEIRANGDLLQWAEKEGIKQLSRESEVDYKRRLSAIFGAMKR